MDCITEMGRRGKAAAAILAGSSSAVRNAALLAMRDALRTSPDTVLAANAIDLQNAAANKMPPSLQDRLRLTPARLDGMIRAIDEVRGEADPLGEVRGGGTRPNGLRISRVSVPLGVVAVIFEARPNVASDAAALCVKSGNAVILRGGKEAIESNKAIVNLLRGAVVAAGLPADSIQLVEDTARESAQALMKANGLVDVLIPRGGAGLIRAVVEYASV
ncbi:MAG: aldehyde dehydrogenase family protein, partial [Oscillospiraceae bacterium]|nr:aldehyde dehydrogenase family protein [Oscillospiraceae bacterium]